MNGDTRYARVLSTGGAVMALKQQSAMRLGQNKGAAREAEYMHNPLANGAAAQEQAEQGVQPHQQAQPPEAQVGKPLTIAQIFEEIDGNGNGVVEFGEFAQYWGAKQVETRGSTDEETLSTIWELFEKYDADGSKGLSKLEFRELLTEVATGKWKEQTDPRSGRTYYVNPITRQSQWTRPGVAEFLQQQGIVETAEKPGGRRPTVEIDDDSGTPYEDSADVHMVLNMWKIYIRAELQNRKRHYSDAFTYLIYTFLLMSTMVLCTPLSASLLAHQEALTDLLLDEEFQGVANHKKSWYDVMTPEEMWEWMEGPLHDAFYPDANSSPVPLLWSNELLGRVQLRQARVEPTKCLSRNWVPFTYRAQDQTPAPGRACAGTYSNEAARGKFGGEATFKTKPAALAKFKERRKGWTDDDRPWDPDVEGSDVTTDAWSGAAEWYEDWGHYWLDSATLREPPTDGGSTTLKGSPVFVESFFGELNPFTLIGRNRFGNQGYAVTLPRNRWAWEEQVRQLKGEYVCVSANKVWGDYIASLGDAAREERANGCTASEDCPLSREACTGTWESSEPFIDKYSRMLVVTFNLYNGNDFDWDEEEWFYQDQDDKSDNVNHLDDHFVFAQVSFTFGPSGHIEKYQRMSIVRPMREYGYIDSGYKTIIASLFALMAVVLFLGQTRTAYRMGLRSYFFTSENSVWNLCKRDSDLMRLAVGFLPGCLPGCLAAWLPACVPDSLTH
eukprot:COSAG02_NODE_61_length_43452_cov_741.297804_7_plen_727_part_00